MDSPGFFERIRQRKIVQWAVAYGAGAWVFLEFMGYVADQFGWPVMVGQVLLVLVACGLLVVLVIAWYHGEKGRQWVSGPELLIIALLLLISGGVVRMIGSGERQAGSTGSEEEPAPATAPSATDPVDDRPSIAVLPFNDFSPDPANAYFADGIQEEITSRLSLIRSLAVKGRSSVERYRKDRPPVPTIAQELSINFLLEGSARVAGERVRLNARRFEDALAAAEQARALHPDFPEVRLLFATVYSFQGRYAETIEALRSVPGSYGQSPKIRSRLAYNLAQMGDDAAAREILEELLALADERYVSAKWIAFLYMGLGEDDQALEWFERAVDDRADWIVWIHLLPGIDRHASNPRFQEILRRMNLSPEGGVLPR